MNAIEHLTEDSFEVPAHGPGLTVINFWAGWCGPCRAMAPRFQRAAALRPRYRFAKVDVRDGRPVAAQAGAGSAVERKAA